MKINMKLSRVGMNMQEATIVRWFKAPGETFDKGDVLYEIETEKVTQEVEAPGPGTLLEILLHAPRKMVDQWCHSFRSYQGASRVT